MVRTPPPDRGHRGAPPSDVPSSFSSESTRRSDAVERARVRASDWVLLSPAHRKLIARNLRLFALGKGGLAESLSILHQRRGSRMPERLEELLGTFTSQLNDHYCLFRELMSHLGIEAGLFRNSREVEMVRRFLADASPSDLGAPGSLGASELGSVSLAYAAILHGVTADAGYDAVMTMLERNGALDGLHELFSELRSEDRALVERVRAMLADRCSRNERLRDVLSDLFDRALLPSLQLIREFRANLDFVSVGLVPEEFVTSALDRFFEFAELTEVRDASRT